MSPQVQKLQRRLKTKPRDVAPAAGTCDLADIDEALAPMRHLRVLSLAFDGLLTTKSQIEELALSDMQRMLEDATRALGEIQVPRSIAARLAGAA